MCLMRLNQLVHDAINNEHLNEKRKYFYVLKVSLSDCLSLFNDHHQRLKFILSSGALTTTNFVLPIIFFLLVYLESFKNSKTTDKKFYNNLTPNPSTWNSLNEELSFYKDTQEHVQKWNVRSWALKNIFLLQCMTKSQNYAIINANLLEVLLISKIKELIILKSHRLNWESDLDILLNRKCTMTLKMYT